jgi:hypothetical protein
MSVFADNKILDALLIIVATLTTLLYFHFGIRRKSFEDEEPQRPIWLATIGKVGEFFIAITFGALFSGVYLAAIVALIERAAYIWNLFKSMFLA